MLTEGLRKFIAFDPFSIKFMIPVFIPPARLIVCRSSIGLNQFFDILIAD
jgi:hypothetical protein